MASKEARERKLKEIQEIAEGWGKMIAREAFPDGPGLDVTLAEMEEYAVAASRALVKGAVESMTATQGEQFGEEALCPACGRMCAVKKKSRPVVVRGGEATLDEPVGHCPTCRRDFFRRPGKGLRSPILTVVIPAIIRRSEPILACGATFPSLVPGR